MNRARMAALLFSAVCLLISLLNHKIILNFFPGYDWFAAIRFEYINHYLIFAALTRFLETMHPKLLHKTVVRVFYAIVGIFIAVTLATEPKIFSLLLYGFSAVSILLVLYVLIRMATALEKSKPQNALTLIGLLPVALLGVFDILSALNIIQSADFNLPDVATPIGMVFLVFCYGLAVAQDYADTERELGFSRMKEAELLALNGRVQARLSEIEAERLRAKAESQPATLDDFDLSPREREVALHLLDGKSREEIISLLGVSLGTVNTICTRIYKKAGASGASELMKLLGIKK